MIDYEVGDVLECARDHFAFRTDGQIVPLDLGEMLIVVETEYYQAKALRVNTSECVMITTLEIPNIYGGSNRAYTKVNP